MPDTAANSQASEEIINDLLTGAVDLHCHSGPSVMPRKIDHIEAMEEASAANMRALLFKDHYYSVTPVTELLNKHFSHLNVEVISGVPLNNTSGGLNPYAVNHGLSLGARMVWMPTFSAGNHIRHLHHRGDMLATKSKLMKATALSVVDARGDLLDEVKIILDQIAEHDCVLSGGHLHISEIMPLFVEAKKRGVKRLLVNHPTYVIDAREKDLKELASMGAYMEHSVCMFVEGSRFQHFDGAELEKLITWGGVDNTILGSDLGQVDNPTPVEGFRLVIALCLELGYSPDDIRKMINFNPCKLIGIDPAKT